MPVNNFFVVYGTGVLMLTMGLGACQGGPAGLPEDPRQQLRAGDRIEVQRELTVPAQKASVTLQYGRITGGASVDRFDASCRFVMMQIQSGPQKILPGEFMVSEVRYWEDAVAFDYRIPLSGGEFVGFETTLRLHSERQPAVHSLVCRHEEEHTDGRFLSLSEIQQALGEHARIIKGSLR